MQRSLSLAFLLVFLFTTLALAEGPRPPADWNKPKALPPANGEGQVSFKQGGKDMTLPLQHIEIDKKDDLYIVGLKYIDAKQENRLELYFGSMPKLGKDDPRNITGFNVKTKAGGLSRAAANRTKCVWTELDLKEGEVSGALSCTGMTDLSAQNPAPDVTEVKFSGKVK
jgi:hypothetical protein